MKLGGAAARFYDKASQDLITNAAHCGLVLRYRICNYPDKNSTICSSTVSTRIDFKSLAQLDELVIFYVTLNETDR